MQLLDPIQPDERMLAPRAARRSLLSPALVTALAGLFAWSSHAPADALVYWLWAAPVVAGVTLACATRRALPLSPLVRTVGAAFGAYLLCAGRLSGSAHAVSPESLALGRAFGIGFATAVLAREVLLRKSPLLPGRWLAFLSACVSLAAFGGLEVVAWAARAALARPAPAASLGAPWELLLVYAGAASALVLFTRRHDEEIQELWVDFTSALDWRRAA